MRNYFADLDFDFNDFVDLDFDFNDFDFKDLDFKDFDFKDLGFNDFLTRGLDFWCLVFFDSNFLFFGVILGEFLRNKHNMAASFSQLF